MKADEIMSAGLDVHLDQFGVDIQCLKVGRALPVPIRAVVDQGVTELGDPLINSRQIRAPKKDLNGSAFAAEIGDKFILPAVGFDPPARYEVRPPVVDMGPYFDCSCVKA